MPGGAIQSDQVGVRRGHEELISEHGDAAIRAERCVSEQVRWARPRVLPDLLAGTSVQCKSTLWARHVHDPVSHNWCYLQPEVLHVLVEVGRIREKLLPERNRKDPLHDQFVHVSGADLREFAITVPVQVSVVAKPIAGPGMKNP